MRTFDFETPYTIGHRDISLIVSYTYSAGRPATREDPEDPPEIDFSDVFYRQFPTDDWVRLSPGELLHTLILEDDQLSLDILDQHNDGPDPDLEAEDIAEAERLAKEHFDEAEDHRVSEDSKDA